MYRHDRNSITDRHYGPLGIMTRATISIRYPVPYTPLASKSEGRSRIRCKLNIPATSERTDGSQPVEVYKYDGYVSRSGKYWQWVFQGRPDDRRQHRGDDMLLMYTKRVRIENTSVITGVMLTQNQEKSAVPTVSTIVVIPDPGNESRVRKIIIRALKSSQQEAKYLANYFELEGTSEGEFMRTLPRVIDLASSADLGDVDKSALKLLFSGLSNVNTSGLYLV